MLISDQFPLYRAFDPAVPVYCVTCREGGVIHRFFDTSPISPSGRYLAVFRLPYEDRLPSPGDRGQIVLVDLQTGSERVLDTTAGWEMQVGANLQWGASDSELYYNDVDTRTWIAYGVGLDPLSGNRRRLNSCIFEVSPDGRFAATTDPVRARFSQTGYGVVIPDHLVPRYDRPSEQDGLTVTDLRTGASRLLISVAEIIRRLADYFRPDRYPAGGEFFGFQCKWNTDASRLLMVLRWISADRRTRKAHVLTLDKNGRDLHLASPAEEWAKGGHHINWHPDGEHLTMNINLAGEGLRFVIVRYDGTGYGQLVPNAWGSGHPSVHSSGRFLITDSYTGDYGARPDGTTPIRLVTIPDGREIELARMQTRTPYEQSLRLDPHPAWDRTWRYLTFNGYVGGTRRVYIADLGPLLDAGL